MLGTVTHRAAIPKPVTIFHRVVARSTTTFGFSKIDTRASTTPDYHHTAQLSRPNIHTTTNSFLLRIPKRQRPPFIMGKKKTSGAYNDFLDGEKLRDNTEIRTSLQSSSSITRAVPPRPKQQENKGKARAKNPALTHFLCLPLITESSYPQLSRGLEKLKQELGSEGVVPIRAVRPVGTLHLTLGVMALSDAELEEAMQFLQALDLQRLLHDTMMQLLAQQAAEDGRTAETFASAALPESDALTVDLKALVPMQDARRTSILYAEPVDGGGRLVPFARAVRELFMDKGFMVREARELRLHATIVNTIYAKPKGRKKAGGRDANQQHGRESAQHSDEESKMTEREERREGHGPDAKSWRHFNARTLMEQYKDFIWAEGVRVDRVQICKMGAKKIWSGAKEGEGEVVDERYEVVCEKKM